MRSITLMLSALALAATAGASAQSRAPAPPAAECDRACLIKLSDDYVAALVAHDPKRLPMAADAVTVENIKRIAVGQGLWTGLGAGPTTFLIHVADPVSQQVGLMAMVTGGDGKPELIGVRLKRAGGRIVEAEHMVAGNLSPGALANLRSPRAALLREVPYDYADSRGRMIWLGKSYYDALDDGNSQESAFGDDCERHENGLQTSRNPMTRPGASNAGNDPTFAYLGGLGCAAQMDTNMWEYITQIGNRRVEIADPVTGLVWGMSHFHHDMTAPRYRLIGVPGAEWRVVGRANGASGGFDLPAIHIFKVWGGKIHEIEAMGIVTPHNSPSGWEK